MDPLELDMNNGGDARANKQQLAKYNLSRDDDGSKRMDLFLTGDVVSPEFYSAAVVQMVNLREGDRVIAHIHTSGGNMKSALMISHAMDTSKAEVTTRACGRVCSAGVLLFINGDRYEITRDADFMCHPARSTVGYNKLSNNSEFLRMMNNALSPYLVRGMRIGLLTEDEVRTLHETGEDIYISGAEARRRMNLEGGA